MRLSRRMCWSLGAACVAAGLGLPWRAARVNEAEVVPVVEKVRLRPALVRLPAGSFLMGSPEGEEGAFENEQPQRLVELPAFSLCQTEVTQGQYEAVMGENPSYCELGCGDELPVQNVSWYETVAYLNKLTERESEALVALGEAALTACYEGSGDDVAWVEGCTGYRLPTEAEWEYAARAGTTTRWSFGDEEAALGEYAWYDGNAESKVHAVGTQKANPWGLYDVHGNVWEWVWDGYDSYQSSKVLNGVGTGRALRGGSFGNSQSSKVLNSVGAGHALRGGSFLDAPRYLRSALRDSPNGQLRLDGFRCARGPGPER